MIITTTVYLTAEGGIRLATRSDSKPRRGELAATLELDVPEILFQPQAVTLRATVTSGKLAPVLKPVTGASDADDDVWTAVRVRRLLALSGMDAETLARRLTVSLTSVRGWERASGPIALPDGVRAHLAALEAEAMAGGAG